MELAVNLPAVQESGDAADFVGRLRRRIGRAVEGDEVGRAAALHDHPGRDRRIDAA